MGTRTKAMDHGARFQLVFPPSKACLWDRRPVAGPVRLSVESNSWVRIRVSSSAVQLAVRASQQCLDSPLRCILLGTACVSRENGLMVEVDRFDRGCVGFAGLQPTAPIPGDVVVHCHVGSQEHSGCLYTPASLVSVVADLKSRLVHPPTTPDPAHLLHLSIAIITGPKSTISLKCHSIHPKDCILFLLHPLPIVQSALARNLSGHLPLPLLQGAVKWGYLTMEITRKLVLLLSTDPKAVSVPLVGVWVSGVSSVRHPAVWSVLLYYKHCDTVRERVREGGEWLCLVYTSGRSQPTLWEVKDDEVSTAGRLPAGGQTWNRQDLTCSVGEMCVKLEELRPAVTLELHPGLSPSLQNLLDSAVLAGSQTHPSPAPHPIPSPHPSLPRDSQLSCFSTLDGESRLSLSTCCTSPSHMSSAPVPTCPVADTSVSSSACLRRAEWAGSISTPPCLLGVSTAPPVVFPEKQKQTSECSSSTPVIFPEKLRHLSEYKNSHIQSDSIQYHQDQQLRSVQCKLKELLVASAVPTEEKSTNTGSSLLHGPEQASSPPATECSMDDVSIATATSFITSNQHSQLNIDLCSLAPSSSVNGPSLVNSGSVGSGSLSEEQVGNASQEDNLLLTDQYQFYQNMLAKVSELLHDPMQKDTSQSSFGSDGTLCSSNAVLCVSSNTSQNLSTYSRSIAQNSNVLTNSCPDLTLLPIPRILNGDWLSHCSDSTVDESTQTVADAIAKKYVESIRVDVAMTGQTASGGYDGCGHDVSLATKKYLQRHHLWNRQEQASQVLDIGRLRTLPKLF